MTCLSNDWGCASRPFHGKTAQSGVYPINAGNPSGRNVDGPVGGASTRRKPGCTAYKIEDWQSKLGNKRNVIKY